MSNDTTITAGVEAPAGRRSLWGRLYHGETTFDFVGRRRVGYGISGIFLVLTVIFLIVRGLNLGIDFKGGVSWEVASASVSQSEVESVLSKNGISVREAKIEFLQSRGGGDDRVRVQVPEQTAEVQIAVQQDLANLAGASTDDVSRNVVSATWGKEITKKAIVALIVFIALLSVYISWRFEWKMAIAAIAAMLHDVAISLGIYAILHLTVTPATVIAFLTILGFSLYDTIVVFDKVHENAKRFGNTKIGYGDIVNLSSNEVLMRSLNTSIAALLPVLSVLVVGAWVLGVEVLVDFALALFIGLLTGSYSSLFIATPILASLKGREKRYSGLRDRHASGDELARLRVGGSTGSRSSTPTGGVATAESARALSNDAATVLSHPPRPRKQRRR